MSGLEARMRRALLALAMTSNGRTTSYDSSGGGTADYVLVDNDGRARLGRGDAPHLGFAARWERAGDELERQALVAEAERELNSIVRSHANPTAFESKKQRDARILSEGAGWSANDVAISFRVGIMDVRRARDNAGLDPDTGRARQNGNELTREERKAEILRLQQEGRSTNAIAAALNLPRSSVRYVLARLGAAGAAEL